VCSHNTLKDKSSSLQEEIRRLEQEQEHLIQAKEKELLDQVTWNFKLSLLYSFFCLIIFVMQPVLGICDFFVQIRGSIPLTTGSGSGSNSGSDFF
jgi:hypothetical protein